MGETDGEAPFLSPSGRGWIGRRPRRVRGMLSRLLPPSPSSGAARHLLTEGEKNGPVRSSFSSPHRGEVARRSRVGEGVLVSVYPPVPGTPLLGKDRAVP